MGFFALIHSSDAITRERETESGKRHASLSQEFSIISGTVLEYPSLFELLFILEKETSAVE